MMDLEGQQRMLALWHSSGWEVDAQREWNTSHVTSKSSMEVTAVRKIRGVEEIDGGSIQSIG